MKRLNLLPSQILVERRQAVHRRRATLAIAVVGITALAWGSLLTHQSVRLNANLARTNEQLTEARQRADAAARLDRDIQAIRQDLEHQQALKIPVAHSDLLFLFSQLIPDDVMLTELDIEAPAIQVVEAPRTNPSAPPNRKLVARNKPISVVLRGRAVDNAAVANMVRLLGRHPLFDQVTLINSRAIATEEHSRTAFHITAEIPLNRSFIIADARQDYQDSAHVSY